MFSLTEMQNQLNNSKYTRLGEDVEIVGGVHIEMISNEWALVLEMPAQQRALQRVAEPTPAILHRWDS